MGLQNFYRHCRAGDKPSIVALRNTPTEMRALPSIPMNTHAGITPPIQFMILGTKIPAPREREAHRSTHAAGRPPPPRAPTHLDRHSAASNTSVDGDYRKSPEQLSRSSDAAPCYAKVPLTHHRCGEEKGGRKKAEAASRQISEAAGAPPPLPLATAPLTAPPALPVLPALLTQDFIPSET